MIKHLSYLAWGFAWVGGVIAFLVACTVIEYVLWYGAANHPSLMFPLFALAVCYFVGWLYSTLKKDEKR